jgi:hypothetical protein
MFVDFVKIFQAKIVLEMSIDFVVDFGQCFGVHLVFGFVDL